MSQNKDEDDSDASQRFRLLERHDKPQYGPMLAVYNRLELEANQRRMEAERRAAEELAQREAERAEQRARDEAERLRRAAERNAAVAAQLEVMGHGAIERSESRPVKRRTLDHVPLCEVHAESMIHYGFISPKDIRLVMEDDEIQRYAAMTGMRVGDLRDLHACYFDERCAMCGVVPSPNNCQNCSKPLHPQWPAIYCSNRCAMEDR